MNFYAFYKKRLGLISERAFALFWSARFEECFQLLESLVHTLGSPLDLGQEALLIYHYCALQCNKSVIDNIIMPLPPSISESLAIANYEALCESSDRYGTEPKLGVLQQPEILSKAFLVVQIGHRLGCTDIIETGSFLGQSAYIFSGSFDSVHTIEADERLHKASASWIESQTASRSRVHCYCGNSSSILPSLEMIRQNRVLFFLDAHFSTGITSNKYGICPLIDELDSIFSYFDKPVLVIDDLRCMSSPGYPSIEDILARIPRGYIIEIMHDQLISYKH